MAMDDEPARLNRARGGDSAAFSSLMRSYEREIVTHCYRMLGSLADAEDTAQETWVRAWSRLSTFEGRASFRAWVYKIATHACLDALDSRRARALPDDLSPAWDLGVPTPAASNEPIWLEPIPDALVADGARGPEARVSARESIALAFLVTIQCLPPRQRAVLLLRDVVGWSAEEVADLLESSVPSVNSALQRARESIEHTPDVDHAARRVSTDLDDARTRSLVIRYVRAWESGDLPGLVELLASDATVVMPPVVSWYRGVEAIAGLLRAVAFPADGAKRFRMRESRANGQPAFATEMSEDGGITWKPQSVHVLDIDGDKITRMTVFLGEEPTRRLAATLGGSGPDAS